MKTWPPNIEEFEEILGPSLNVFHLRIQNIEYSTTTKIKSKKHIIKNKHDYKNKYRLSNPLIGYNIQNTNPIWDMESENHKTSTIQWKQK